MVFKQLFEPTSSTYTYLLACPETGQAALIDPVLETFDRDMQAVQELGFSLACTIETHIHADHLTGSLKLKALTGSKIAGPALDEIPCRDIGLREGEVFSVGNVQLHPLFTPGHTDTHHAYLVEQGPHKMLFSGDALLIEACGRTDFQGGDAGTLYDSIQEKFFTLPNETLVYPAHDYEKRCLTTIGQEKLRNPRLSTGVTREQFIEVMGDLDLPYPKKINYAVPGNIACGQCPEDAPEDAKVLCEIHDQG